MLQHYPRYRIRKYLKADFLAVDLHPPCVHHLAHLCFLGTPSPQGSVNCADKSEVAREQTLGAGDECKSAERKQISARQQWKMKKRVIKQRRSTMEVKRRETVRVENWRRVSMTYVSDPRSGGAATRATPAPGFVRIRARPYLGALVSGFTRTRIRFAQLKPVISIIVRLNPIRATVK